MKFIEGFEDYFVTREGYVFSFKIDTEEGKVLRPKQKKKGYYEICLYKDKKRHNKKVHRLVALAYLENPYDYPEVDHIDTDPSNNNLTNLRWCPKWYNVMRQDKRQVREWIDPKNGKLWYRVQYTKPDGKGTTKMFKDKETAELFLKMITDWLDTWDNTPTRPDFLKLWAEKTSPQ